jgi:2-polyprenyl-3-methyl-5-hydroxy-6-metoxy-1,4-benzoquinol methylase
VNSERYPLDSRGKVLCPICANISVPVFVNTTWYMVSNGRGFRYRACENCQLIFCDPLPTSEELDLYYSTQFDYSWYAKRKWLKQAQSYHRWLRVRRLLQKRVGGRGSLLDVGCGPGWFLQAARREGWQVEGVELPGASAKHAKQMNLDLHESTFECAELPAAAFDVVTMWHSLEHMRDPFAVLQKVKAALRDEGIVVIALPNRNSLGLARRAVSWCWLQQPFVHIWHFSSDSIKRLLTASGFRTQNIETRDTWDAQYLYDAVLNPRLEYWYSKAISRLGSQAARHLRNAGPGRLGEEIDFWLAECSRILTYIPYVLARPIISPSFKSVGSELFVTASVASISQSTNNRRMSGAH